MCDTAYHIKIYSQQESWLYKVLMYVLSFILLCIF